MKNKEESLRLKLPLCWFADLKTETLIRLPLYLFVFNSTVCFDRSLSAWNITLATHNFVTLGGHLLTIVVLKDDPFLQKPLYSLHIDQRTSSSYR